MPVYTRHLMSLDLEDLQPPPANPGDYRITTMDGADLSALARLLLDSYVDTPDWDLVPELQTYEGCLAFLKILFSGEDVFEGQEGSFRTGLSYTLCHDSALCGAAYTIATEEAAHLIDFSIAPGFRGRGLGRFFLGSVLQRFKEAGCRRAFLLVTAHNEPAVRLYTRLGFAIQNTQNIDVGEQA